MQNILSIIQQYKIADEICANEYENCSAQIRGLLKTAIAFHFPKACIQKTANNSRNILLPDFAKDIKSKTYPPCFSLLIKNTIPPQNSFPFSAGPYVQMCSNASCSLIKTCLKKRFVSLSIAWNYAE